MSYFTDVRDFHEATGLEVREEPIDFTFEADEDYSELFELRRRLHTEEWSELQTAWEDEDLIEVADAICDLIYVLCGTAVSLGIPLDECFAEVQRSNMSKLGPNGEVNRRADGKILKHKNFSPPDLRKVIYGES